MLEADGPRHLPNIGSLDIVDFPEGLDQSGVWALVGSMVEGADPSWDVEESGLEVALQPHSNFVVADGKSAA